MNRSLRENGPRGNVAELYDAIAKEYDERFQSGCLPDVQNSIIFSTLREVLGRKRNRILDAGGGTGFYSLPFAAGGHEVVILDKSRNMLKRAEDKANRLGVGGRVRTVLGPMESIEEPDESFDVILCHLALCHLNNPLDALTEFSRVLRKQGILSLVVENRMFFSVSEAFKDNLAEALKRLKKKKLVVAVSNLGILRTFGRQELLALLKKAGFRPVRILGLRIISDYLAYALKHPPADLEKLREVEFLLSESPQWNSIGRFHFLICKKSYAHALDLDETSAQPDNFRRCNQRRTNQLDDDGRRPQRGKDKHRLLKNV